MCQAKNVLLRSDQTKLLIKPIKGTETDRIVIEYRRSTALFYHQPRYVLTHVGNGISNGNIPVTFK